MGKRKTITAIATQGNPIVERDSRLKEYYIQYSDDGSNWQDYSYEGQRKVRFILTGRGRGVSFSVSISMWSMVYFMRTQHFEKLQIKINC